MPNEDSGWIGFDLDGTLASHLHSQGNTIGDPVPAILELLKGYVNAGVEVRIVTARANPIPYGAQTELIEKWLIEHLGYLIPITDRKDYRMLLLYDDRAVGVEENTGIVSSTERSRLLEQEYLGIY